VLFRSPQNPKTPPSFFNLNKLMPLRSALAELVSS